MLFHSAICLPFCQYSAIIFVIALKNHFDTWRSKFSGFTLP
jgi:hypothetical protein